MGFFDTLFGKKEQQVAEQPKSQADSREDWQIVHEADSQMDMSVPPYDLTEFPFENREYVHSAAHNYNRDMGRLYVTRDYWYADRKTINVFGKVLRSLEEMLDADKLGIKGLPKLTTDLSKLKGVSVPPKSIPQHAVFMTLTPLTKTGRKPKYPVVIRFDSGVDGSVGEVSFLPDGSVGKADVHYWKDRSGYSAYYKIVGGELVLSLLEFVNVESADNVILYRLEQ